MEDAERQDTRICPFLGAWWDPKSVCRYASGENRCYAGPSRRHGVLSFLKPSKPYRHVGKDYQDKVCLTGKWERCSSYRRRMNEEGPPPPREDGKGSSSQGKPRKG